MHPDCVLMKRLDVLSPRLDQTELENDGAQLLKRSTTEMETEDELLDLEKDKSSEYVKDNYTASNDSSIESSNIHIEDEVSLYSDESNLSVGQENFCKINPSTQHSNKNFLTQNTEKVKSTRHIEQNVENCGHSRSSNNIIDEEETPNNVFTSDIINSFAVAKALQNPPLSTSIQQVFLKNSHFYAEEIMKHQIKLMTGAINMTGPSPIVNLPALEFPAKLGFCNPFVLQTKSMDRPNLSKIQSHLSAISQLGAAAAAAAAVTVAANTTTHNHNDNIINEPNNCQLEPQQSRDSTTIEAAMPSIKENNESGLKFSIENILKADFGKKEDSLSLDGFREGSIIRDIKTARPRSKKITTTRERHQTNVANSATNGESEILDFSTSLANICAKQRNFFGALDKNRCGGSSKPQVLEESNAFQTELLNISKAKDDASGNSKKQLNENSDVSAENSNSKKGPIVWPAWVYCTRYSDRPSSGPRTRKPKKSNSEKGVSPTVVEDKRPRTAFSGSQLARLKHEFNENRYLTEKRRQQLSSELGLNEAQIKIWFQNKRAKLKKSSGTKNPLALQLMAQGLYNHTTVPLTREEEEMQELQDFEMAESM